MVSGTEFAHVGFMTKLPTYLQLGTTTHLLDRWRAGDVLRLIESGREIEIAWREVDDVIGDVDVLVDAIDRAFATTASLTADDIRDAARTFLVDDGLTVVTLDPVAAGGTP